VTEAAPARPPGVPEAGFWNPAVGKWEVSQKSEQGAREGECLFYRSDGSLFSRFRFAADVQDGPFAIYHPDGQLARAGAFAAGQIEGIVSSYASAISGNEPLRACCVPPTAARLDGLYQDGQLVQEVFYDGDGRPILSDGRPWPPRPSGVPDDAEYDEAGARWARRRPHLEQFWDEAGRLGEEIEYAGGARRAVRRFDGAGRIAQSEELGPGGRRHGAFVRRLSPDETSPYADGRIREERGAFDLGQAVGPWTFLDREGQVLRTVPRGAPFVEGAQSTSPAFAPRAGRAAAAWWTLARALIAEGRVREGLCAACRGAAVDRDRVALEELLADCTVALSPELSAQRGDALVQSSDATVTSILDALLCGADPASALRALGAVLPGADPAAPDFVAASLLLAPERRMTHLTRALIRFQVGDEAGARADAEVVERESPEGATSLRTYMQAAFRPYEFWPARETLAPDPELVDLPTGLVRDLESVRGVMAVYATRLGRLRAAVEAMIGSEAAPTWLPPDLSALLPDGPVELRRVQVAVEGDGGADAEGDETAANAVEIDEQIETKGLGVPALLGAAQVDWAALSWLAWSVGLDRVALPEALAEPPLFAVAMKMIVTRAWRAQDRLATGSLLARANGVPSFEWQGVDIDALPQHLARVVAEEYTSVRSLLLWLASPEVLSPFQPDLRDA
jgi:antitoxin component YwqK of YwqJK toxin-antitoxin module